MYCALLQVWDRLPRMVAIGCTLGQAEWSSDGRNGFFCVGRGEISQITWHESCNFGAGSKAVGHLALRQALRKETFDPIFRNAPVFAQFSSLGSLDANWVHNEFQRDTLSAGKYLDDEGEPSMPRSLTPSPFPSLPLLSASCLQSTGIIDIIKSVALPQIVVCVIWKRK